MMGEKHKSVQTVCCGVKYLSTHRVAAVSQHMTQAPALLSRRGHCQPYQQPTAANLLITPLKLLLSPPPADMTLFDKQ